MANLKLWLTGPLTYWQHQLLGADRADMIDRADMADREDWADRADRADMADKADMADMADTADKADMAAIACIWQSWNYDPLTHSLTDITNCKEMLSHLKINMFLGLELEKETLSAPTS